jgi:DNA-binding XRE family transcriptional regulator
MYIKTVTIVTKEGECTMFRLLRSLMTKYNVNTDALAKAVGMTSVSFYNKINGRYEFKLSEARSIVDYFNSLGEKTTLEELFFTAVPTIVTKEEGQSCN